MRPYSFFLHKSDVSDRIAIQSMRLSCKQCGLELGQELVDQDNFQAIEVLKDRVCLSETLPAFYSTAKRLLLMIFDLHKTK